MKVGDLVKIKHPINDEESKASNKTYVVTWTGQWHAHLHGFDTHQVHSKDHLEVVSKA